MRFALAFLCSVSPVRNAAEARAMIAWLCQKTAATTLEEVVRKYHRDASTLSRHAGNIENKKRDSNVFDVVLGRYMNTIMQA